MAHRENAAMLEGEFGIACEFKLLLLKISVWHLSGALGTRLLSGAKIIAVESEVKFIRMIERLAGIWASQ